MFMGPRWQATQATDDGFVPNFGLTITARHTPEPLLHHPHAMQVSGKLMSRQSPTTVISRVVWLLVCLAACVLPACSQSSVDQSPQLRVAVTPWPGFSFAFLAEELGYFRQAGVDVRLLELGSLADARRIFEQGQADVVFCTLAEAILMNSAYPEENIRVIAAVDYSSGSDMLLGQAHIPNVASLRQCKIGVEPESVSGLCLNLALASAGLTVADVTLVPMPNAEMLEAMQSHKVDAVQIYTPDSDAIEQLAGVHRLWDTSSAPGLVLDLMAARGQQIEEQPDKLRAFLSAFERAQRFYREQPQVAVVRLARRGRLSEAAFERAMEGLTLLSSGDPETLRIFQSDVYPKTVERVADSLRSAGMRPGCPMQVQFDSRILESDEL